MSKHPSMPAVCAIEGGGIQFEWKSADKHLKLEFLPCTHAGEYQEIAFLKEDKTLTTKGLAAVGDPECAMEYGLCPLGDWEKIRELLNWFAEEEKA